MVAEVGRRSRRVRTGPRPAVQSSRALFTGAAPARACCRSDRHGAVVDAVEELLAATGRIARRAGPARRRAEPAGTAAAGQERRAATADATPVHRRRRAPAGRGAPCGGRRPGRRGQPHERGAALGARARGDAGAADGHRRQGPLPCCCGRHRRPPHRTRGRRLAAARGRTADDGPADRAGPVADAAAGRSGGLRRLRTPAGAGGWPTSGGRCARCPRDEAGPWWPGSSRSWTPAAGPCWSRCSGSCSTCTGYGRHGRR